MKHLIISRIDLHMTLDSYKYKETELWKKPGWRQERIQLLNDWCRVSLRKQTNQNFTFISLWHDIVEDGKLDNEIQIQIRPNGTVDDGPLNYDALVNDKEGKKTLNFSDQIRDKVSELFEPPVLVTNLDCDDALHKDYVEAMQNQPWPSHKYYFDVQHRYCYNIRTGAKGMKQARTPSPFATTYEPEIMCWPLRVNHTYLGTHMKGKKINSLTALQTVSGSNMFSKGTGKSATFNLSDYI